MSKPSTVKFDMCKCIECGEVSKVSDCGSDFGNHNGWELPPYTIHYCPKCPDGEMDDYFYSPEKLKEIENGTSN